MNRLSVNLCFIAAICASVTALRVRNGDAPLQGASALPDTSNCVWSDWSPCSVTTYPYACQQSRTLSLVTAESGASIPSNTVPCNYQTGVTQTQQCAGGTGLCPNWVISNWTSCDTYCSVKVASMQADASWNSSAIDPNVTTTFGSMQTRSVTCMDVNGFFYDPQVCQATVSNNSPAPPISFQPCDCSPKTSQAGLTNPFTPQYKATNTKLPNGSVSSDMFKLGSCKGRMYRVAASILTIPLNFSKLLALLKPLTEEPEVKEEMLNSVRPLEVDDPRLNGISGPRVGDLWYLDLAGLTSVPPESIQGNVGVLTWLNGTPLSRLLSMPGNRSKMIFLKLAESMYVLLNHPSAALSSVLSSLNSEAASLSSVHVSLPTEISMGIEPVSSSRIKRARIDEGPSNQKSDDGFSAKLQRHTSGVKIERHTSHDRLNSSASIQLRDILHHGSPKLLTVRIAARSGGKVPQLVSGGHASIGLNTPGLRIPGQTTYNLALSVVRQETTRALACAPQKAKRIYNKLFKGGLKYSLGQISRMQPEFCMKQCLSSEFTVSREKVAKYFMRVFEEVLPLGLLGGLKGKQAIVRTLASFVLGYEQKDAKKSSSSFAGLSVETLASCISVKRFRRFLCMVYTCECSLSVAKTLLNSVCNTILTVWVLSMSKFYVCMNPSYSTSSTAVAPEGSTKKPVSKNNQTLVFPKLVWRALTSKCDTHFVAMQNLKLVPDCVPLGSGGFTECSIRWIPKTKGFRPVVRFPESAKKNSRFLLSVLASAVSLDLSRLGCSVLNKKEAVKRLFTEFARIKQQGGGEVSFNPENRCHDPEDLPFHDGLGSAAVERISTFVCDVENCYESVNHEKLFTALGGVPVGDCQKITVQGFDLFSGRLKSSSCRKSSKLVGICLGAFEKALGPERGPEQQTFLSSIRSSVLGLSSRELSSDSFKVFALSSSTAASSQSVSWSEGKRAIVAFIRGTAYRMSGKSVYSLNGRGIPQGCALSSLLCALYYGAEDMKLSEPAIVSGIPTHDGNSFKPFFCVRLVDDMLFASFDEKTLRGLYNQVVEGNHYGHVAKHKVQSYCLLSKMDCEPVIVANISWLNLSISPYRGCLNVRQEFVDLKLPSTPLSEDAILSFTYKLASLNIYRELCDRSLRIGLNSRKELCRSMFSLGRSVRSLLEKAVAHKLRESIEPLTTSENSLFLRRVCNTFMRRFSRDDVLSRSSFYKGFFKFDSSK